MEQCAIPSDDRGILKRDGRNGEGAMHINNQETENKSAFIPPPVEKDGINGRRGDEETNNGKTEKKILILEKKNCKTVEQKKK